ncbi:hypothetical protein Syun_008862 [Stephania yunnanensis]|uniref:Uncharacterized protein n=1 Tax=Stephania yunnanensis TaxID=152371 RepID=A0AAP0KDF4_9MAGN
MHFPLPPVSTQEEVSSLQSRFAFGAVQDDSDAVQELWRRRDKADKGLIESLRAVARLPSHEETFSISPYSNDEDNSPSKLKHEGFKELKIGSRSCQLLEQESSGSDLGDGSIKHATMSETVRARKIVIHCGRNRHATNSPRSEASSCHKEQDLTTSNGKLMVLKISSKFELRRFCRTTGSVAMLKLSKPNPDDLGYADSVSVEEVGAIKIMVILILLSFIAFLQT